MVPLVGVYSTDAHPFGLVYEYMDGLDLRQYLKNEHDVDKLKLVLVSIRPLPPTTYQLMAVYDSWQE